MKIHSTYYFASGSVAALDPDGEQIPGLQGRWEDVWRKVWDAADEDTVFHGWPSMTGEVSGYNKRLPEHLWPCYMALLGARAKGLILAVTERVERHFPGNRVEYTPQKLKATTDMLKNLTEFHDEMANLGMTGGELMLEWQRICQKIVKCYENALDAPEDLG